MDKAKRDALRPSRARRGYVVTIDSADLHELLNDADRLETAIEKDARWVSPEPDATPQAVLDAIRAAGAAMVAEVKAELRAMIDEAKASPATSDDCPSCKGTGDTNLNRHQTVWTKCSACNGSGERGP